MNLVGQILKETIDKFNKRVSEDPKLAAEIGTMTRKVQVQVEDGDWYYFVLSNGRASDPVKGSVENPDIRVTATSETLKKLFTGELRAMKALATKKVRVQASLEDMLRLRKLF